MLKQVGLGSKLDTLPTELSGGQQQRVAIARALVHNPLLIVCDEPTSALDHTTGAEIMELFRREALKEGRTLVIVTHDARIFQYADRIGVMDDGRITRIVNSPSEL
jgi:putative ABC transport system ATP-binding protein